MKEVKPKKCKVCKKPFTPFNSLQKYCSGECKATEVKVERKPRKMIKPISDKRKVELQTYTVERREWLIGKKCAVFPDQNATQCHHMMGRVGYADQWAKDNGISLYLDKRFWLPVSMEGHRKIEENHVWAKQMGFSISRETIL